MLQLSQRDQRWLCRVIFLLAGVLPALVVIIFTGYWLMPGRASRVSAWLEGQLETAVSIRQAAAPQPFMLRIDRLELRDQESGHVFAIASQLQIDRRAGRLRVVAEEVLLDWNQREATMRWLKRWVRRDRPQKFALRARRAAAVEIPLDTARDGAEPPLVVLKQPVLALASRFDGTQIAGRVITLDASSEAGGPLHWRLERNRQTTPPSSRIEFETGAQPIPLGMLAGAMPLAGRCGRAATFAGNCRLRFDQRAVAGEATGTLQQIDCNELLGPESPHKLNATATLQWHRLQWNRGRIVRGEGRLSAASGTIGHSLVDAARTRLAFRPAGAATSDGEVPLTFDQLAMKFSLSATGLTIWGDCQPTTTVPAGSVVVGNNRVLVAQPPYVDIPLSWLVAALSTPVGEFLPATREAGELAKWLPLPRARAVLSRRKADSQRQ